MLEQLDLPVLFDRRQPLFSFHCASLHFHTLIATAKCQRGPRASRLLKEALALSRAYSSVG